MQRAPIALRSAVSLVLGALLVVACSSNEAGDDDANAGGGAGSRAGQAGTSSRAGTSGANAAGGAGAGQSGGSGRSGAGGSSGGAGSGGSAGAAGNSSAGGSSAGNGTAGAAPSGGNGAQAGSAGSDGGQSAAGGRGGAVPSDGCSKDTFPASGTYPIDVDGTEREYIVKVPADYDPALPHRLIFAFHGRMYDAESVDSGGPPGSGPYYGIEAEAGGTAIFVAPQALSTSWTNQDDRDVAYVDAMLERLEGEYCIDESRVFSVGFSMGAIMTITLGCSRSDVFRAIAPQSGSTPSSAMLPGGCTGGPIPYFASHGLGDMTIRPEQGLAALAVFAEKNGCSDTTLPSDPDGCVSYEGCDAGYPVTWCTFEGEHEPAPFAGTAIWDFLAQF